MRCVRFNRVIFVTVFLCYLVDQGSSISNSSNSRSQEGVDLADDYRIEVTHREKVIDSTKTANGHYTTITVTVHAFNRLFSIDLKLNTLLFAADYVEKSFNEKGSVYHKVNHRENNCFYLGSVRNEASSSAAVSTCTGIDGYFAVGNISYHIESQSNLLNGPHKVYRSRDDAKISHKCGKDQILLNSLMNPSKHARRMKRSSTYPQDLDKKNKIVEAYVAVDHSAYLKQGSVSAAIQRAIAIVNSANSGFQPIGIYIILVGTEVWNTGDKISIIPSNKDSTLANWAEYRKRSINPTTYNDNAVLISGTSFENGELIGYAYFDRMCSNNYSASIVCDVYASASVAGSVMDHEMGHSFGLRHDNEYSSCPCTDTSGRCIMNSAPNSLVPPVTWSQCSLDQFTSSFQKGADLCLYNVPKTVQPNTGSCGNGIVESGEQCDCGNSDSQQCNRNCCDPSTCQLKAPATCAFGRCCNIATCQIKSSGTLCRGRADASCDLPEYCDGAAGTCPSDTYAADGTPCTTKGAPAYCYNGLCRNHESQCELIWGPGTPVSSDNCYELNSRGMYYGNCGLNWLPDVSYTRCNTSDAKCGLLQCQNLNNALYTYVNFITSGKLTFPNGDSCHTAMFDFGLATQNPGLVPDGAQCEPGKMCRNQKCIDVTTAFTSGCSGCAADQVCNNVGQCQYKPVAFGANDELSTPAPSAVPLSSTSTSNSEVGWIVLGVVLGVLALVAVSLISCKCCCPQFFTECCGSCWPGAKSTTPSPALAPVEDVPRHMGPVPMPSRLHWIPVGNYFNSPSAENYYNPQSANNYYSVQSASNYISAQSANNYHNAPTPRQEALQRPAEFYRPQNPPNWAMMRRAMPSWGYQNNFPGYRLYPNPAPNMRYECE